jgi:hypothetical protein
VNINCRDVFGNEFKSITVIDFPKLESFETFDQNNQMGCRDGHHEPSLHCQAKLDTKLMIIAFALVSLGVVLNAIMLYLFCKHRRVNNNPAVREPAVVPELTVQGVNQAYNDFVGKNRNNRLKDGNEPIPQSEKTNPYAIEPLNP